MTERLFCQFIESDQYIVFVRLTEMARRSLEEVPDLHDGYFLLPALTIEIEVECIPASLVIQRCECLR